MANSAASRSACPRAFAMRSEDVCVSNRGFEVHDNQRRSPLLILVEGRGGGHVEDVVRALGGNGFVSLPQCSSIVGPLAKTSCDTEYSDLVCHGSPAGRAVRHVKGERRPDRIPINAPRSAPNARDVSY